MKRIVLMVAVAAVMALLMAAGPALATIHPLAEMECADDSAPSSVHNQEPPGLTPGGTDQSGQIATPVVHTAAEGVPLPEGGLVGVNPSGGASMSSWKEFPETCAAPQK